MSNHVAPEGQVYVCGGCGKRSRDRFGTQAIDPWWDISCAMYAVLCLESSLVLKGGRVISAKQVEGGDAEVPA